MAARPRFNFASPSECLAAHDAAHESSSAVLHGLATRLMRACGLTHMAIDELDAADAEGSQEHEPIVVLHESAAQLLLRPEAAPVVLWSGPALDGVPEGFRFGDCAGRYMDLYDLCLVRREAGQVQEASGLVYNADVTLGPVRMRGPFKFPVLAQPVIGDLEVCSRVIDEQECMVVQDECGSVVDVLVVGFRQLHDKPLQQRLDHAPGDCAVQPFVVNTLSALPELDAGRYLVRWENEVSGLEAPLWFWYDAGLVRPGQYVEPPVMYERRGERETEGVIAQEVPDGCRVQLHKDEAGVCVFAIGCDHDIAKRIGVLADEVAAMPGASFVLDAVLSSPMGGGRLRTAISRRKDLSEADLSLTVFDCLYLNGRDLSREACSDRVALIGDLCHEAEHVFEARYADANLTDGVLSRPDSAPYCIDGTEVWDYYVADRADEKITVVYEPPPPEELDGLAMSRRWIETEDGQAVEQDDEPNPFIYRTRYDGLVGLDLANEVLNAASAGKAVEGAYWFHGDLGQLRQAYANYGSERTLPDARMLLPKVDGTTREGTPVLVASARTELLIAAPPFEEGKALRLEHVLVGDALQSVLTQEIMPLGPDPLAAGEGTWEAVQRPPTSSALTATRGLSAMPEGVGTAYSVTAAGFAVLGVQKPYYHEVFLVFDGASGLSGRYVWNLITAHGRQMWIGRRPDEQTPYLLRHDRDGVVSRVSGPGDWVVWNPEGIVALSRTSLASVLPVNWEARIEPFQDEPRVVG